jgi:hypothetical protein
MKKPILLLIIGLFLNIGLSAQQSINYPIKSGSVAYTMSMMGTDNLMTLYFEDNGNKNCMDMQMEMFGMKMHNRTIIKDKKSYVLDMTKKTYTENDVTDADLKKSFYMSDEDMTKEGITKLGEEEILGKNCQIYTATDNGAEVKFWVWKGMMLKMESSSQGMTVSIVATSISETVPEKDFFEIPSDFTKS